MKKGVIRLEYYHFANTNELIWIQVRFTSLVLTVHLQKTQDWCYNDTMGNSTVPESTKFRLAISTGQINLFLQYKFARRKKNLGGESLNQISWSQDSKQL